MMTMLYRSLVCLSILLISVPSHAQWVPAQGMSGTTVQSIAASGSNVFAGTDRGVYRSSDNGANWTAANNGLSDLNVLSILVCNISGSATLLAGTLSRGVFISSNNGTSWSAANSGLPSNRPILALASSSVTSGVNLYAAAFGSGVFLSTDAGTNWTPINSGLTNKNVQSLLVTKTSSGVNLFAGTNGGGVFLSNDNGASWKAMNNGLTTTYVYSLAAGGSILLAGTYGAGVFLSGDNGVSWKAFNLGLSSQDVYSVAARNLNVFAGTSGGGVFLATDGGFNWTQINPGLGNTDVRALALNDSMVFAGTAGAGVWRRPLAGMVEDVAGVERTVVLEMFTNSGCPPCKPANESLDAWLGTFDRKNRLAIVKYHVSWPDQNDPFYQATMMDVSARDTYYGNNYVPHVFIDGKIDGQYDPAGWPTEVEARLAAPSAFVMSASNNLTTSGGTISVTVTAPTGPLPSGTFVLHTILTESNRQYIGSNGEARFDDVMRTMMPGPAGEVFTIRSGESVVITHSIGWNPDWKMSNCEVIAFVQINETKDVLQSVRCAVPGTSVSVEKGSSLPSHCSLSQNYPNPFNPSTEIEFQVAKYGSVSLRVFDVLGRNVALLVDQAKYPGTYRVTWNAANMPSGVYYYRLQTGDFVQTKKLMVVK